MQQRDTLSNVSAPPEYTTRKMHRAQLFLRELLVMLAFVSRRRAENAAATHRTQISLRIEHPSRI